MPAHFLHFGHTYTFNLWHTGSENNHNYKLWYLILLWILNQSLGMLMRIICAKVRNKKNLLLFVTISFLSILLINNKNFGKGSSKSDSSNTKIKRASHARTLKLLLRMKRLKKLNHDDPKLIHHIKSVLVKPASKDSHLQLEGCELLEVFDIIWKTISRVSTRKEL